MEYDLTPQKEGFYLLEKTSKNLFCFDIFKTWILLLLLLLQICINQMCLTHETLKFDPSQKIPEKNSTIFSGFNLLPSILKMTYQFWLLIPKWVKFSVDRFANLVQEDTC